MAVHVTDGNGALLEYSIKGAGELIVPKRGPPARKDGLWNATCCELFVRSPGEDRYWEFNFSPSGQWAAYSFSAYRNGMNAHSVDVEPHIECAAGGGSFVLEADVDLGGLPPGPLETAISVVIEETGGTRSYWALAHPPGKPDFHHPACFTAFIPAPGDT